MKTWKEIRGVNARAARRLIALLCVGLFGMGVVFASRVPPPLPLEALDPTLMQAVIGSVSQRDVEAILAFQHSSAPVHLQLYTSCDEVQRCTIFAMMDFPQSQLRAPAISLRVAVRVTPGAGSPYRTMASSWQVQSNGAALSERAAYAGNFSDLKDVPPIGENNAIASLLTAMQSAIGKVLGANGVIAKPDGQFAGPPPSPGISASMTPKVRRSHSVWQLRQAGSKITHGPDISANTRPRQRRFPSLSGV